MNNEELREKRKKAMLSKLTEEIKELEYKTKHAAIINLKRKTIKNLKISANIARYLAPYALTAGIIAGGFSLCHHTPFYCGDKMKVYASCMDTYDTIGNNEHKEQYKKFSNERDLVTYYGKWEMAADGTYYREIKTYPIKISKEDIDRIANDPNADLENLFQQHVNSYKETKDTITSEELAAKPMLRATVYSTNKNNYIIREETVDENLISTIIYIVITMILEIIPSLYRQDISDFDYREKIANIKSNYNIIDNEVLTRKLLIKKSNYTLLTRDNNE